MPSPFQNDNKIKKFTVNTPYPVGPVHFYLKDYGDFTVLFDTGPNTKEARDFLTQNIDLKKLKYTFITHCHADHYGLIKFISENSDSEIIIPRNDIFKLKNLNLRIKIITELLQQIGLTSSLVEKIIGVLHLFAQEVPVPEKMVELESSKDILDSLKINYVSCPGHSISDIVYLVDGFAISADVFLIGIFQTPLLEVDPEKKNGRFLNYQNFCNTIVKMKKLEKDFIFLPGHRDKIDSIDARVKFYVKKMCERISILNRYIKDGNLLMALKSIVNDLGENPLKTYLKLSELFFFIDFYKNPELLINSLKEANIDMDLTIFERCIK